MTHDYAIAILAACAAVISLIATVQTYRAKYWRRRAEIFEDHVGALNATIARTHLDYASILSNIRDEIPKIMASSLENSRRKS